MNHSLLRLPASRIWVVLVLATGLSYWLVEGHRVTPQVAASAAVLIAGFKARLVFLHFMDLRNAPWPWRLAFEAWIGVCVTAILLGFWFG